MEFSPSPPGLLGQVRVPRLPLPVPLTIRRLKREADLCRLRSLSAQWRTDRQLERLLSGRPRRPDEPFRFAVLGDAEPGRFWIFRKLFNVPGVFCRQLRGIQAHDVDFSIQLGDMVSRGVERNYLDFFEQLQGCGVSVPYLTVIGNHDRRYPHGVSDSRLYRSLFGRTNYYFDHGGARCVALDTSAKRVTDLQLKWLDRVLDTPLRKAVFTHIPPAALRAWTDYGGARGVGGFRRGAKELTGLLARRGVDRVYLGHIHAFGVQDYKGVRYVLTGGGGSPLFPSGVEDRGHHYLVVTASPRGFSETVHWADGRVMTVPRARVILSRC